MAQRDLVLPATDGDLPDRGGTPARADAASDKRAARSSPSLSRGLSGTNLARAGDYNLRTVLQAIRLAPGTTRVAIAGKTGLTAATIANITGRLMQMGLIQVTGRRQGGRGQPPLQLTVKPDGAFGIGVNIDRDHLTVVTMDLAGVVRSRVTREIAFALPDDVRAFVADELDGVIAAGGVRRDRVLGIGVALPDELGCIELPGQPASYRLWNDADIADLFAGLPWQVHRDNDAAAAALGEAEFGTGFANPSFLYLLVSAGLGGGLVIDRRYHRGAANRAGEIGLLPDRGAGVAGASVQDTVSTSALLARLTAAGSRVAGVADLDQLEEIGDPVLTGWIDDAVRALIEPMTAVNHLLDPDAVLIGGRLPGWLIARLAEALNRGLAQVAMPARAPVLPAGIARDAPATGAAILPFLEHLLPSDATLIQAGR